jgi:antitoxin FitA
MGMIQIRSVPGDLHRKLKAKAAREGKTLSDLLLEELPRIADRVSMREMLERIAEREPLSGLSPARIAEGIRADREERDARFG